MHHGPCPATNEHPRRDTDVILRLSKSTTEDLSVFISFGSLSNVKMVVLDENIGRFFRFVILIPGSFGDVLGIENQFCSIEKSRFYYLCYVFPSCSRSIRVSKTENRFSDQSIDYDIIFL